MLDETESKDMKNTDTSLKHLFFDPAVQGHCKQLILLYKIIINEKQIDELRD